jgi:hypothetical protein
VFVDLGTRIVRRTHKRPSDALPSPTNVPNPPTLRFAGRDISKPELVEGVWRAGKRLARIADVCLSGRAERWRSKARPWPHSGEAVSIWARKLSSPPCGCDVSSGSILSICSSNFRSEDTCLGWFRLCARDVCFRAHALRAAMCLAERYIDTTNFPSTYCYISPAPDPEPCATATVPLSTWSPS